MARLKFTSRELSAVDAAMSTLLSDKQIRYVKAQTWLGPSKRAVVRRLINAGIKAEIANGKATETGCAHGVREAQAADEG